MLTSSPPTSAPGTDKTGMDFRRILPEIRCQSCLSPGSEPTPRGGFSPLLPKAFGRAWDLAILLRNSLGAGERRRNVKYPPPIVEQLQPCDSGRLHSHR